MSAKEAVIEAIRAMPEELSEPEIIAKLSSQFDPEFAQDEWEDAWLAECERRLARARAGETESVPHEEVMRQMREKYG